MTCLAYHFRKIAMVAGEGWIGEREREEVSQKTVAVIEA